MKTSKGKIVLSSTELYDCYNSMAKMIYPVLEQYRKLGADHVLGGIPDKIVLKELVLFADNNNVVEKTYVFQGSKTDTGDNSENTECTEEKMQEIFNEVIDHMINTFKSMTSEKEFTCDPIDLLEYVSGGNITVEEARERMSYLTYDELEKFSSMLNSSLSKDMMRIFSEKYNQYIQIGLEYFSKYFQNLWD